MSFAIKNCLVALDKLHVSIFANDMSIYDEINGQHIWFHPYVMHIVYNYYGIMQILYNYGHFGKLQNAMCQTLIYCEGCYNLGFIDMCHIGIC